MFIYNRVQNTTKEAFTDIAEKRVDPHKIKRNE